MTTEGAKFTPGPWELVSLTTKTGRDKVGLRAGRHRLCDLSIYEASDYANARLIQSAPELYEALRWAEAALAPFSKEPAEKSGMALIRNALAKAEGRK